MAHFKHHLRVIAREKEKHRLHRLGGAPGLASAASPALRAFSSSHIRGGGGPGSCARGRGRGSGGGVGTAHAGRARGAEQAGARPAGGGAGGRAVPAGSPSTDLWGGGRRQWHLPFAGWRLVVPGGEGEGRRGEGGDQRFLRGGVSPSQQQRRRQNQAPPTSSLLGVGASKRWGGVKKNIAGGPSGINACPFPPTLSENV